MIGNDLFVFY